MVVLMIRNTKRTVYNIKVLCLTAYSICIKKNGARLFTICIVCICILSHVYLDLLQGYYEWCL